MESVLPIRRRSYGSIRSPVVKRDIQSLVVLKGWLYKLEGGALKQWKRRWCVLADFCLFFYKSHNEDKVFSTVLLPSYKINPCDSNDHISKKFAFKAEHQNMKTYYFAADSKESMKRWMNAMSLASIMQNFSNKTGNADNALGSVSNEDEDSGFASYRNRRFGELDPNPSYERSRSCDALQQRSHNYRDGTEMYLNSDDKYPTPAGSSQQLHSYGNSPNANHHRPARQPLYANAPPKPKRLTHADPYALPPGDQYSASGPNYGPDFHENAYHDYPEYSGYFITETDNRKHDALPDLYQGMSNIYSHEPAYYPDHVHSAYDGSYSAGGSMNNVTDTQDSVEHPKRPHSADFLERDSECFVPANKDLDLKPQPQRPKSSLEYCDRYWESAKYGADPHGDIATEAQHDQLYMRMSKGYPAEQHPEDYTRLQDPDLLKHNQNFAPVDPLSYYADTGSVPANSDAAHNQNFLIEQAGYPMYATAKRAQLPQSSNIKKKRAHEESMRRLLEWKQRMLQSPLTRRAAQYSSSSSDAGSPRRPPARPPLPSEYRTQVLQELESYEARLRQHRMQQSRTESLGTRADVKSTQDPSVSNKQYYGNENVDTANLPGDSPVTTRNSSSLKKGDENFRANLPSQLPKEQSSFQGEPCETDNVMYCVDSENNEILIYGDSYVTEVSNENKRVYTQHHDKNDNQVFKTHVKEGSATSRSGDNQYIPVTADATARGSSQDCASHQQHTMKSGISSSQQNLNTSYSSDDEDDEEKEAHLHSRGEHSQENVSAVEIHSRVSRSKGSPDYVNISAMGLKGRHQKNVSPKPNTGEPSKKVNASEAESGKTLDMSRDDFYRASKLFYTVHDKKGMYSPSSPETRHVCSPEPLVEAIQEKCNKKRNVVNVSKVDLDKDVGLPLTTCSPEKKEEASSKEFEKRETSDSWPTVGKEADKPVHPTAGCESSPNREKSAHSEGSTLSQEACTASVINTHADVHAESQGSRKHMSFEELRMQLQRKREAPPPNIVQERIKCFESAESKSGNLSEEQSASLPHSAAKSVAVLSKEQPKPNNNVSKIFKHRPEQPKQEQWEAKASKRCLHSDTEAIAVNESCDSFSDDGLTMKSAPILLSPLSSVLADLRKTADSGKERAFEKSKSENLFSKDIHVRDSKDSESVPADKKEFPVQSIDTLLPDAKYQTSSACSNSQSAHPQESLNSKKKYEAEEEAYLPMTGIRSFSEPEYVAMDDGRQFATSCDETGVKVSTAVVARSEPVYNEPYCRPQSFLHDVYEKQKLRSMSYDSDSSSSDESSSDHIYETPRHSVGPEHSLYQLSGENNECHDSKLKAAGASLFTGSGKSGSSVQRGPNEYAGNISLSDDYKSFCRSAEKLCSSSRVVASRLNHSVPDLLQLQEVKDSDASDADDEASRDFDTSAHVRLPSYQSAVLDMCHNNADGGAQSNRSDGHSSFDSEIVSLSLDREIECASRRSDSHHSLNLRECTVTNNSFGSVESFSSKHSISYNFNCSSISQSKLDQAKDLSEDGKKIHFRKLRVYTKGKKPEGPRLYPVPFNLEEGCTSAKRRSSPKNFHSSGKPVSPTSAKIAECGAKFDGYGFEKNVNVHGVPEVYAGVPACAMPTSHFSFAPDVVPSDQVGCKPMEASKHPPTNPSPSSAPYYYSDLLPEDHTSHLMPQSEKNEFVDVQRHLPQRNAQDLPNNVRCKSPPCTSKSDIGRRVNKINSKFSDIKEKVVCMPSFEYSDKTEAAPPTDVYPSQSKYIDAERNRYEAGHTLEKTRRMNMDMPYFMHRASTPDFKSVDYQNSEPVYENLIRDHPTLSHRLSCSLEALPKSSDCQQKNCMSSITGSDKNLQKAESPLYENIEFFNQLNKTEYENRSAASHDESVNIAGHEPAKLKSKESQSCSTRHQHGVEKNHVNKDFGSDTDYLDQNELRRVSQKQFFGKYFRAHHMKCNASRDPGSSAVLTHYSGSAGALNDNSYSDHIAHRGKPREDYTLRLRTASATREDCSLASRKGTDGDISSSDEASVDADYRYRQGRAGIEKNRSTLNKAKNVSDSEIHVREPSQLKHLVQLSEGVMNKGKRLSVSAGDLLGKTHEELVLLLIQLRRNQTRIMRAKEKCLHQLDELSCMNESRQQAYAKRELLEQVALLEKQYEVGRPLVNLVDNMVKLGSLYGSNEKRSSSAPYLPVSEAATSQQQGQSSNQNSDHCRWASNEESEPQGHLSEVYGIDRNATQEPHSYSSLQQDKEMLEHTLHGMKSKILDHQDKPIELQKLRKQQRLIEKELTRVKRLLSHSAKKIEDATTKNDQLEQEILLLRQKLQQALQTGSCEAKSYQSRADLEAELTRMQNVLEELASYRQEINYTVETLKSNAKTGSSSSCLSSKVRASPTGVAGSAPLPLRKKQQSTYLETDLDTMKTCDLASISRDADDIPVYANAEEINSETATSEGDAKLSSASTSDKENLSHCSLQDINEADEKMKRFYGILPREKPCEIKTVRIVKRQSERRNKERDKKRVTYGEKSSIWVVDEPDFSSDDHVETDDETSKKVLSTSYPRPTSIPLPLTNTQRQTGVPSAHERLFGNASSHRDEEHRSVPQEHEPASTKATKRSKRRHYTVSGCQYLTDPQLSEFKRDGPRSRDDVDMERCLRTANTPDIVRSTIKKKEVFDDKVIDREIGLPQKISIPERYIEDEPERLSASERLRRSLKAENIRKMLSETTASYENVPNPTDGPADTVRKQFSEQKRKRAHLLALNHVLAQEVMERSKAVAASVYCSDNDPSE